jgi:hypothetical protein
MIENSIRESGRSGVTEIAFLVRSHMIRRFHHCSDRIACDMTGRTRGNDPCMVHGQSRKGCGTRMTALAILASQITMDGI